MRAIVITSSIVLLGLFLCFFLYNQTGSPVSQPRVAQIQPAIRVKPDSLKSKNPNNDFRALLSTRPSSVSASSLEPYLLAHKRSASALVAAYFLCRDQALLNELKQFYNDPSALSLLATELSSPQEKEMYAEKLANIAPNNSLGYLLKCKALIANGDIDAAKAWFARASNAATLDIYAKSKESDMRDAFKSLGSNSIEARLKTNQLAEFYSVPLDDIKTATLKTWNFASDVDGKIEMATSILKISALISNATISANEQAQIFAYMLLQPAFKQLPPDTEYGNTGLTISDYLKHENSQFEKRINNAEDVKNRLLTSSDDLRQSYFERCDLVGEKSANEWFLTQ